MKGISYICILLSYVLLEVACNNNHGSISIKSLSQQQIDSNKVKAIMINDKIASVFFQQITDSTTDSAIVYFKKAILLDSTNNVFYNNLFSAYFSLKKYNEVLILARKYLRLPLGSFYKASAELDMGMAFYCMGEKDSAIIKWNDYENIFEQRLKIHENLNDEINRIPVFVLLGEDKKALDLIEKLKKAYPEKVDIINQSCLPLNNAYSLLPCNNK